MSKRRKKVRGYFCWCCERMRPNEQFSRAGRKQHVCKRCSRLGKEELAYRQAVRDIDRLHDYTGRIGRKNRERFESFLKHENPRVREYAETIARYDAEAREEWRRLMQMEAEMEAQRDAYLDSQPPCEAYEWDPDLDDGHDIPF